MISKAAKTKFANEEKFFDAMCPICLMYYTNDNPPITLKCSNKECQHLKLCKLNIYEYYLRGGGKIENGEVNNIEIEFVCF